MLAKTSCSYTFDEFVANQLWLSFVVVFGDLIMLDMYCLQVIPGLPIELIKVIVLLLQVFRLPYNLFHLNHHQGQFVLLNWNLGQLSFDSSQFLFLLLQGLLHSSQF
jgi:hypothetical protein